MSKIILTGKFKRDSNKCASFSLPFQDSKEIDFNRDYIIEINGPIRSARVVKYKHIQKVIIKA